MEFFFQYIDWKDVCLVGIVCKLESPFNFLDKKKKMLSSPDANTSLQRTTSEPELSNGELGKRTVSNASQCSKIMKRSLHIHHTGEDLLPSPRVRSISGYSTHGSFSNGSLPVGVNGDVNEVDDPENDLSWQAFEKLRKDLERAQSELRTRDTQCEELTRVRDIVDQEIEELTASLFEEANKMVYEANVGRASAEKKFHEAQLKLDGLQAECHALKALVITSTPSNPGGKKGHKKAPSLGQICNHCDTYHFVADGDEADWAMVDPISKKEVDPIVFQNFCSWIEDKCPLKEHTFLNMIHKDDITPCLRFMNEDLSKSLYKAAQFDTLAIEPIKSKPKKCALTGVSGPCPFRVRTADSDDWYPISASCRARIVAVMDFLTFLRYIRQGILKKDVNVLYWEMGKKRAEISLARLGLEKRK